MHYLPITYHNFSLLWLKLVFITVLHIWEIPYLHLYFFKIFKSLKTLPG